MKVEVVRVCDGDARERFLGMRVRAEQERFVLNAEEALRECALYPELIPCLICADGQSAGYAVLSADSRGLGIWRFAVDAAFQGRGVGSLALREIISCADAAGLNAYLSVDEDNERAIALYKKAGFEPSGERMDGELVMRRGTAPV